MISYETAGNTAGGILETYSVLYYINGGFENIDMTPPSLGEKIPVIIGFLLKYETSATNLFAEFVAGPTATKITDSYSTMGSGIYYYFPIVPFSTNFAVGNGYELQTFSTTSTQIACYINNAAPLPFDYVNIKMYYFVDAKKF
jgi:hypothetical protein